MVDCAMKSIRKVRSLVRPLRVALMVQPPRLAESAALRIALDLDGVMSLYRGFTPQWMRFGPFTIVQFMVWEKMRNWYGMKGI
eukprot:829133-Rhodomonas_salina.2